MANNFVQPGDVLTITESDLVHPTHTDGLVDSGDPVVMGRIPGVAQVSAAATTDPIAVSTKGVYDLLVTVVHNGISKGETVFIDPSAGTLSDDFADVPFGLALEAIASGSDTINVKLLPGTASAVGANS